MHQVAIPDLVHREQELVVDRVKTAGAVSVRRALFLFKARTGGEVRLTTQDRLHSVRVGGLVELDCAKQVPVIGHRDRRHLEGFGAVKKRRVFDRAVEQGILGMEVQVYERLGHPAVPHSHSIVAGGLDEMS